ncbi:hypothetical protein GCM10022379_59950 [Micromonospora maritima]
MTGPDPGLVARIDALLDDGHSIGQAMRAAPCTEADVRRVKALRDQRAAPPPRVLDAAAEYVAYWARRW